MKLKLFLLLLIVNSSFSQVTDIFSNLNSVGLANLTYSQNYVYYTSYNNKKVYRFDYTIANPTIEFVYQFNEKPNYLYISNNILYVGAESNTKTYKLNLQSAVLHAELIANICGPMVQIGNDLYIGQYVNAKIVKIDVTTGEQTEILNGYKPNYFCLHNNELYFTSNITNSIYKYNPSTNSVDTLLTNIGYAAGIAINNDYLFVCESANSRISYYSLSNLNYVSNIQLTTNSWPNGILLIGNELYFIQTVAGKISKIELSTLSNDSFSNTNIQVSIYPNPTTDFLNIQSKEIIENYEIYSIEGKRVAGSELIDNKINVSELSNGNYILILDKKPFQFIKK